MVFHIHIPGMVWDMFSLKSIPFYGDSCKWKGFNNLFNSLAHGRFEINQNIQVVSKASQSISRSLFCLKPHGAQAYQEGRRCRWAATLSHFWSWSISHIWPEPIHELQENVRCVILWTLCGYNMWFCALFCCGSLGLRPGYSITFPPNPPALITSKVWQTWLWQILLCNYSLSRKVPCH